MIMEQKASKKAQPAVAYVPVPEEQQPLEGSGTIQVQVLAGRQSLLLPDADVTITRRLSVTDVLDVARLKTNISGLTPEVRVPAPSAEYAERPNGPQPFAVYQAKVEYPGYVTQEEMPIFVFGNSRAFLPVAMIPVPAASTEVIPPRREEDRT